MAVESSLKPSEPGCLTRDMADGSSPASTALKFTSPNPSAWVSGWALSWWRALDQREKKLSRLFYIDSHCYANFAKLNWTQYTHKKLESIKQWWRVSQAAKFKLGWIILWYISISTSAEEHLLYTTEERVSQVLHRVHHHTTIDCITWNKECVTLINPTRIKLCLFQQTTAYTLLPAKPKPCKLQQFLW